MIDHDVLASVLISYFTSHFQLTFVNLKCQKHEVGNKKQHFNQRNMVIKVLHILNKRVQRCLID